MHWIEKNFDFNRAQSLISIKPYYGKLLTQTQQLQKKSHFTTND